jgi:hypothetical protein
LIQIGIFGLKTNHLATLISVRPSLTLFELSIGGPLCYDFKTTFGLKFGEKTGVLLKNLPVLSGKNRRKL